MKYLQLLIISIGLYCLCSCTVFYARQSGPEPEMQTPKPLVLPLGKNWQVIEEAPTLSNESGRLPFQMEQSVQPEGASKPVSPEENRRIDTSR